MLSVAAPAAPRHFVVITWGSMGDVHPFLGIACALKARGHRVTYLTNQSFEDLALEAGIEFHPIGTMLDAQVTINDPDLWHPRKGFQVIWRSSLPAQRLIADFLVDQPDASSLTVIAHPLTLPGAMTARDRVPGMRLIAAYLAPGNLRTTHDPMWLGPTRMPRWVPQGWRHWMWRQIDARILDPLALPGINALRASHGLPPVDHYSSVLYGAADSSLLLFPEWFGPAMPDWPAHLVGGDFPLFDSFDAQPNADLNRFLAAGDKPIVFTFGSAMTHAAEAFAASVRACERLGRRGLLLTMFEEQIPRNLPPGVKWLPYVPFRDLLPHAAAVVHHGGIGSMAEALRAGVPQLVVPMAYDQFDNAARVQSLGVGAMIARHRYRAGAVSKLLQKLLRDESVRANCGSVAARFNNHDSLQGICDAVEASMKVPAVRA